jgi:hypothetical protein
VKCSGFLGTNPGQVAASDDMRTYQALSYDEKWCVTGLVAKGEAPHDPRMASAAVELAERYQRSGRGEPTLHRFIWLERAML